MRNRNTIPAAEPRIEYGLVAWLEQTRIQLPLKVIECVFRVSGGVVTVEMDQVFHQTSKEALDCLYTFPLPAGAAVYRCEMHVNGRVVRAKVAEEEAARKLVNEKKAQGHRTGLVTMERDNLFTLALGNVQPNDLIVVRLAYFQTVTRLRDWTSLHIPFCPGVRYIPGTPLLRSNKGTGTADDTDQVPDASRISPPRIDQLHPDAAHCHVEGIVMHPGQDVRELSSPSHPVLVRPSAEQSAIELARDKEMPDRDFMLRWTEVCPADIQPAGWSNSDSKHTYALVELNAPADLAPANAHQPQAYYVLVDRSGSMAGHKWAQAMNATRRLLAQLKPEDRAFLSFFSDAQQDFAENLLPPGAFLNDPALQAVENSGTQGGTELLPAFEHLLKKVAAQGKKSLPPTLVLITDGQIGNEAAVLDLLRCHLDLRVHVFGLDTAINDGFLGKLAAQNRGTACLLSPNDDVAGAVVRLAACLQRPVLAALKAPAGWRIAGHASPQLHAGERLTLALLGPARKTSAKLKFTGSLPGGGKREVTVDLAKVPYPAPRLLWAKREMHALLAGGKTKAAIALATKHNVVCEGAAFVAWDEAEQVAVADPGREIYQPAMAHAGLLRHFVSRAPAPAACYDAVRPRAAAGSAPPAFDESDHTVGLLPDGLGYADPVHPRMDRRIRFHGILNGMGLSASVQKALAFEEMIRRAAPDAVNTLLDRLENLAAQIREQARLADEAQRAMQGETATMETLAREQATQFLITQQLDPDRALQIRKLVDELLAARDRRDAAQERVRQLRREFQELLDRFAAAHGAPRLELVMETAG